MSQQYKSPSSGAPVIRRIAFDLSSDDEPFLLDVLERAREAAQPFHQRAIDRLRDAITARKYGPTVNTSRPWEEP